jgi:hypothetical protein
MSGGAHANSAMGIANISGDFDVSDGTSGPSVVFRVVVPYAGLYEGWSIAGSISDQDGAEIYNPLQVSPTFTPITELAKAFERNVSPILDNLFTAGLTTNSAPSLSQVIRYSAVVQKMFGRLYSIRVLNALTYHTDWSKIYPYTGIVPKPLYDLCEQLKCDDIGIAQNYANYFRLIEQFVMFPRVIEDTKRLLSPQLSLDINSRLMVALSFHPTMSFSSMTANLDEMEAILTTLVPDAKKAFMSYIPFPIFGQDLWAVPPLSSDPLINTAWYNSNNLAIAAFGDTGDPADYQSMVCYDDTDNRCLYYSMFPQPVWDEVRLSSIWGLNYSVTDNTFELLTPHKWGNIYIFDNHDAFTIYDGESTSTTSNAFELMEFANNRYVINTSDAQRGIQKPGFLGCWIHRNDIERMLSLEVLHAMHADVLQMVTAEMVGSAVKEIRRSVKETVQANP